MANSIGDQAPPGTSDKELALWWLGKMRDSEVFLGVLKAARDRGTVDVLDTPAYVERHKARIKKLYQGDDDDTVDVPSSLAGEIDAIVARDVLSGREELIEKALAAYLARYPEAAIGLPQDWETTFEAARAEIEGVTSGVFGKGFVASLAAAARDELARDAVAQRSRDQGQERD